MKYIKIVFKQEVFNFDCYRLILNFKKAFLMIKIFTTSFLVLINLYALDISKQKVFTINVTPTTQTSFFSLNHIAKTSGELETFFAKAIKLTEQTNENKKSKLEFTAYN